jgi:hypothetical protein
VKILSATEVLREQGGTTNRAVFVDQQTSVRLCRKKPLSAGPDNQWIHAAEENDEHRRKKESSLEFGEERFHGEI